MQTDDLFIECNKLPDPLSKEEIYELINKKNSGDKFAKEIILNHNIKLVLYEVTRKFSSIDYDKKDLVSEGSIGLIKAINSFNPSKNIEFSTYATKCIDNEILMFLKKNKKHYNVESLHKVVKEDKNGNRLNVEELIIGDMNIEDEYINNEVYHIMQSLIIKLPARDREMIMMFFGFYNNYRYTQQEIAKKFKLSQPQVSRVINKIVKQLGFQLEEQGVIELKKEVKKQKIKKLISSKE